MQRQVCRGLGQERTPSWEELRSWRWLQADLRVTRHLGEQGASVRGGLCCFSQAALVTPQQSRAAPRTPQDMAHLPRTGGPHVTTRGRCKGVRSKGPWVPRHLRKHCALRIAGSVFLDDTDIQMVDFRHSQASTDVHTQAHPRPPKCTAGSVCLEPWPARWVCQDQAPPTPCSAYSTEGSISCYKAVSQLPSSPLHSGHREVVPSGKCRAPLPFRAEPEVGHRPLGWTTSRGHSY